jgi:hypothetical protein
MPIQQSQSSDNQDLLHAIRIEAEFFGFPDLATACAADDRFMPLRNYKIVRGLINQAQDEEDGGMCVNCPSGSTTYLLMALGSMWAHFCVRGQIEHPHRSFKPCTIRNPDVPALVAAAETVLDSNVHKCLEIALSVLNGNWKWKESSWFHEPSGDFGLSMKYGSTKTK